MAMGSSNTTTVAAPNGIRTVTKPDSGVELTTPPFIVRLMQLLGGSVPVQSLFAHPGMRSRSGNVSLAAFALDRAPLVAAWMSTRIVESKG